MPNISIKDAVGYGVLIAAGAIGYGSLRGDVEQHDRDIAELKADKKADAEKLTDIRLDVKEIKATLRAIFPRSDEEGSVK